MQLQWAYTKNVGNRSVIARSLYETLLAQNDTYKYEFLPLTRILR